MFEFLTVIPFFGGFLSVALPFIIVLAAVIFVHEYGHYIVGRWCGIHADIFSLGFGPVMKSWTDKRGTRWQISAIPFGGYVKFVGDRDASSGANSKSLDHLSQADRDRSFPGASLGRRALTVFAGPAANFVMSIAVFAVLVLTTGVARNEPVLSEVLDAGPGVYELSAGDEIIAINGQQVASFQEIYEYALDNEPDGDTVYSVVRDGSERDVVGPFPFPPLISGVEPISPASKAGLKQGDVILAVGEKQVRSFSQLRETIIASPEEAVDLTIWRDGGQMTLSITPELRDRETADGGFEKRVIIGVYGGLAFEPESYTPAPWTAIWFGAERTWTVITASINGIYHMLVGDISATNLQGPLGIAQVSGHTAAGGFIDLVNLIAVISTAIGLMNLFPIPVLDGGHLVIFGYEAVRGRPPSDKFIRYAMSVGMSLLLMLMVFATYNDIIRL